MSYICSRFYRAPELIFGATHYTTAVDVWSAGCVMAELMLGYPLFPGQSCVDLLVKIVKILGTPKDSDIDMSNGLKNAKIPVIPVSVGPRVGMIVLVRGEFLKTERCFYCQPPSPSLGEGCSETTTPRTSLT
mmetsp:Transcript_43863/g.171486  ORF Transcript_43863/g.171486 Transcript_43863/m.171486 type:complete len:132 (+) Transcript_43863:1260-1655(+)